MPGLNATLLLTQQRLRPPAGPADPAQRHPRGGKRALPVTGVWVQHNKEMSRRDTELITTRVLGFETANFRELRNLISLVH